MDHWKQLGVPVALGLVAAALNWYSVSSKIQPKSYVGVNQHVNPGDKITKQMLTKLEINGDHGLTRAALPWEQRSILFDWHATRRLQRGSLILRRDVRSDSAAVAPDEYSFAVDVSDFETPADLYEDSFVSFALTNDDRYQHADPNAERFGTRTKDQPFIGPFRVAAITYQSSDRLTVTGAPRVDALTLVVSKTEEGHAQMGRVSRAFQRSGGEYVMAIVREPQVRVDTSDTHANAGGTRHDSGGEG